MADTTSLTNFLNDVASAIKSKTGDSTAIPASQFDTKIRSIPTGGTYETITRTISENGNITLLPSQGYDAIDRVDLTINVSGGGDVPVKLFSTKQAMDSSSGNQEGDLAIVYGSSTQSITEDTEFSSCTFPNTVVLSEAFSDDVYGRFGSTGSDYFDGMVELSASRFRFTGYGKAMVQVQYTSSDGITYTRTDGGTELQEFGTTIKWEDYEPWNDVLGSFMKIQSSDFQGLFEYQNTTGDYITLGLKLDDKLASTSVNTNVYGLKSDLQTKTVADSSIGYPIIAKYEYVKEENGYTINTITKAYNAVSYHSNTHGLCIVNKNSKNYIAFYSEESTFDVYKYENGTNSKITLTKNPETGLSLNNITLIEEIDLSEWAIGYTGYYFDKPSSTYTLHYITSSTYAGYDISANTTPTYEHYVYAPSQLDATADYVLGKTFYGKNGTEIGTLASTISTSFDDINATLYNRIQDVYDGTSIRVLTDNDKSISSDIIFIPAKRNGTPLYNTSSLTTTDDLFKNCTKLVAIPLLDISNCTSIKEMFYGCTSLKYVALLDTSHVTDMRNVFYGCTSLTDIPLFDTSSATHMQSMFYQCTSLITIPLLNTGSVYHMGQMFQRLQFVKHYTYIKYK